MKLTSDRKTLPALFLNSFVLSMFAFGGGSTIIALLQKRYVEELKWMSGEEMLDVLTQAQSAPGATAVNTSILIGYRLLGMKGALISGVATALPPLIVIGCFSAIYEWIRDSGPVAGALWAMRACAAAMVASAALSLLISLWKKKDVFQIAVLVLAFAVILVFNPSTYLVILAGLALGILRAFLPVGPKAE